MAGHADTADVVKRNKAAIERSFAAWAAGTGGPYDLLKDDVRWEIVGRSAASKVYPNREAFLSEVIRPFNARMKQPLKPCERNRARRPTLYQHLLLALAHGGRKNRRRHGLLRQHRIQRSVEPRVPGCPALMLAEPRTPPSLLLASSRCSPRACRNHHAGARDVRSRRARRRSAGAGDVRRE